MPARLQLTVEPDRGYLTAFRYCTFTPSNGIRRTPIGTYLRILSRNDVPPEGATSQSRNESWDTQVAIKESEVRLPAALPGYEVWLALVSDLRVPSTLPEIGQLFGSLLGPLVPWSLASKWAVQNAGGHGSAPSASLVLGSVRPEGVTAQYDSAHHRPIQPVNRTIMTAGVNLNPRTHEFNLSPRCFSCNHGQARLHSPHKTNSWNTSGTSRNMSVLSNTRAQRMARFIPRGKWFVRVQQPGMKHVLQSSTCPTAPRPGLGMVYFRCRVHQGQRR